MRQLFGTDGIRGVANKDLTPEMAFRMGRICAALINERKDDSFITLGMDTRRSGAMLEGALVAGICSSGVNVRSLGVLSTPALAFLTKNLGASAGIMISASHNPIEDNGLKVFASSGYKLSDKLEEEIESYYFKEDELSRPVGAKVGYLIRDEESVSQYIDFLKSISPDYSGLHVAMDCGHGAVYSIAPEVFSALGARITVLNNTPDGININVKCGSTDPSALRQKVKESGADFGVAFDGDADRVIAVDEKGEIVDGDLLMLLFARYLNATNKLINKTFVGTIMSNGGVDIAAEENGFSFLRTAVGDRYVLEKMLEGGFVLGGEQSGHIIFLDYATTGDGLLTALQLAKILKEEKKPLSSYNTIMKKLPQVTLNCRVARKDNWEKVASIKEALDIAYGKIGAGGRILVRPSGTEPVMRIMVEGDKEEKELHALASELIDIVARELN